MIFIGRLGGDAIAGIAFNMPLFFLALGLTMGLGTGVTASIARFIGKNDKAGADNSAEHAIIIAFLISLILFIVVVLFGKSILSVFDNLITNAINYSDRGDVIISVKYNNDKIIISVIDHGIGVDEKQIERIFERFYRVDSDRSRSSGGTGLGLSIVKHILLAHDSNIEVKSQSSIGSTFSFSLPVLKN